MSQMFLPIQICDYRYTDVISMENWKSFNSIQFIKLLLRHYSDWKNIYDMLKLMPNLKGICILHQYAGNKKAVLEISSSFIFDVSSEHLKLWKEQMDSLSFSLLTETQFKEK